MRLLLPESLASVDNLFDRLKKIAGNNDSSCWLFCDLPVTNYQEVHNLQEKIVSLKKTEKDFPSVLLGVEHHPVFTLGHRGDCGNILVQKTFLTERNVAIVQTKRGGDVTCHGPGQLVFYPIVSLKKIGFSIPGYIHCLEEVMLKTASQYGVEASRSKRGHGIWVRSCKIGSVGIAVSQGITYHGLALNINNDLMPYSWINPCGLEAITTGSIKSQSGKTYDIADVRQTMLSHFENIFQITCSPVC